MNRIFLKEKEEDRILFGHPWIFDNEIGRVQGDCLDGSTVEVLTKSGHFLGKGIINNKSKIRVRLFTRNRDESIDLNFFINRFTQAQELRRTLYDPKDSYRLVFAEADLVPGLVVDRFVNLEGEVFLSVQFLTLGVEQYKNEIILALETTEHPKAMYERSDVHVRRLEGLPEQKGWIGSSHNPIITIRENNIDLKVDLENGQKTGYFLDQKANRKLVGNLAKNKRVLDTFSHSGAFGLNAFKGGAQSVISVDISEEAVQSIDTNIQINKAASCMKSITADVFDLLKDYEKSEQRFDLIVLDPPAFTKNAKMIDKAYGGYKEINLRAMKLLEKGGLLVSCSCSHFFTQDHFYRMIQNSALDAHRTVQILEKRGAGPDHPILVGYPESDYLKCAVMRIW